MSSILDQLVGQLDPATLAQMGRTVGAAPEQARKAVETALPLMLGALQKNLGSSGGAASLLSALDRDHDGAIFEDLAGFFGQAPGAAHVRSLDHIFGDRRAAVEGAVAQASGLGGAAITRLLAMLAPLVLGVLGQTRQTTGADADGLGELLGGAMGRMQEAVPGLGGLLGSLLGGGGGGASGAVSSLDQIVTQTLGGLAGTQSATPGGEAPQLPDLGGLLGTLLGGKR
jgi:hypothetical protein